MIHEALSEEMLSLSDTTRISNWDFDSFSKEEQIAALLHTLMCEESKCYQFDSNCRWIYDTSQKLADWNSFGCRRAYLDKARALVRVVGNPAKAFKVIDSLLQG